MDLVCWQQSFPCPLITFGKSPIGLVFAHMQTRLTELNHRTSFLLSIPCPKNFSGSKWKLFFNSAALTYWGGNVGEGGGGVRQDLGLLANESPSIGDMLSELPDMPESLLGAARTTCSLRSLLASKLGWSDPAGEAIATATTGTGGAMVQVPQASHWSKNKFFDCKCHTLSS